MEQPNQSDPIERDISISEIGSTLFHYKWIFLLASLITAIVVYVASAYILPKKYQSVAVIEINRPDLGNSSVNFPRIPDAKSLAADAQLRKNIFDPSSNIDSIDHIVYSDGSNQIFFEVTALNPESAAEIANAWMFAFFEYIDEKYSIESSIEEIVLQLEKANQNVEEADAILEMAIMDSQVSRVEIELVRTRAEYAHHLARWQLLREIAADAQKLHSQLANQNQEMPITSRQKLSYISIDFWELGERTLLISDNLFLEEHITSQVRLDVSTIIDALSEEKTNVETQIIDSERNIISLLMQIRLEEDEISTFVLKRDIAIETSDNLSTNLYEAQLLYNRNGSPVEVIRQAKAPLNPVRPNLLVSTFLGGLAGLTLSVGIVFALERLRNGGE